jgi:hypothetical protein
MNDHEDYSYESQETEYDDIDAYKYERDLLLCQDDLKITKNNLGG